MLNKSREKKIHLASDLQDGDGKSSSLESSACMRHSEPSLSVSLLPKKCYEPWRKAGGQEKKQVKQVVNVNISKENEITKRQSCECDQSSRVATLPWQCWLPHFHLIPHLLSVFFSYNAWWIDALLSEITFSSTDYGDVHRTQTMWVQLPSQNHQPFPTHPVLLPTCVFVYKLLMEGSRMDWIATFYWISSKFNKSGTVLG